jgi:hypothetical protein
MPAVMATRWLMTAFLLLTLGLSAALMIGGCDDDSGNNNMDLSMPADMTKTHD